jgi:hypothetical protein
MKYLDGLIQNYKNSGIVVDTNLLLLFLVGSFDKGLITKFKRTQSYSQKDYEMLSYFLRNFLIIINPSILTEITNLADGLNRQTEYRLFNFLKDTLSKCMETQCKILDVITNQAFNKFGFADSTLSDLADKGFLILTDDFPFFGYLISRQKAVINFNHIRTEYLLN